MREVSARDGIVVAWLMACVLATGCDRGPEEPAATPATTAERPAPEGPCSSVEPGEEPPLALLLEAKEGPGLAAVLCNRSHETRRLVVKPAVQPLIPGFRRETGQLVSRRDLRAGRPRNLALRETDFLLLEPGKGHVFAEPVIQKSAGAYTITWPPYAFEGVEPGTYDVRVRLESERDRAGGEVVSGAWTGTIESPTIQLTLP